MGHQQPLRTTTLIPQQQLQPQLQLQPITMQIINYLILQGLRNLPILIPTTTTILSLLQTTQIQIQIQL